MLFYHRRVVTVKLRISTSSQRIKAYSLSVHRCSSHANPQSDLVVNMRWLLSHDGVVSHHQRRGFRRSSGDPPALLRNIDCEVCQHLYVRRRRLVGISRRNDVHSAANRLIDCGDGELSGGPAGSCNAALLSERQSDGDAVDR